MLYCVQCGAGVGEHDLYCSRCGARQKTAPSGGTPPPPLPSANPFGGLSDKNVNLLCYIPWMGWIAALIVLATDFYRTRDRVRFHAFQGLYLFAAWLLADWVFIPIFLGMGPMMSGRFAEGILKLAIFGAWIYMLVRVSSGDDYHLPVLGDLAERSVSEQRL